MIYKQINLIPINMNGCESALQTWVTLFSSVTWVRGAVLLPSSPSPLYIHRTTRKTTNVSKSGFARCSGTLHGANERLIIERNTTIIKFTHYSYVECVNCINFLQTLLIFPRRVPRINRFQKMFLISSFKKPKRYQFVIFEPFLGSYEGF